MKYKTPAGFEYEVPEPMDLFRELRSEAVDEIPTARIILRLERMLEDAEGTLERAYARLEHAELALRAMDRRADTLEGLLDDAHREMYRPDDVMGEAPADWPEFAEPGSKGEPERT